MVVVTDANADRLPDVGIGAPIQVERVGTTDAQPGRSPPCRPSAAPGGAQLDLFVAVSNPSAADVTRRLEIYADGELVDARDLAIPAGQRSEALIGTVPSAPRTVEARLAGSDALAVDDRAFALVPSAGTTRGAARSDPATPYLENALALLPRLELYAVGAGGLRGRAGGRPPRTARRTASSSSTASCRTSRRPCRPCTSIPADDGPSGPWTAGSTAPALDRPGPGRTAAALRRPLHGAHRPGARHRGRGRHAPAGLDAAPATRWSPSGEATAGVGAHRLRPRRSRPAAAGRVPAADEQPGRLPAARRGGHAAAVGATGPGSHRPRPRRLVRVRIVTSGDRRAGRRHRDERRAARRRRRGDGSGRRARRHPRAGRGQRRRRTRRRRPGSDRRRTCSAPTSPTWRPGDPASASSTWDGSPAERRRPGQPARTEWWWPLALAALALLAVEWLLFHRPTRRSGWCGALGADGRSRSGGRAR